MPLVRVFAEPPLDVEAIRRAHELDESVLRVELDDHGIAVYVDGDPRTDPALESRVRRRTVEAIQAARRATADPLVRELLDRVGALETLVRELHAKVCQ